jgi:hypothetical protein
MLKPELSYLFCGDPCRINDHRDRRNKSWGFKNSAWAAGAGHMRNKVAANSVCFSAGSRRCASARPTSSLSTPRGPDHHTTADPGRLEERRHVACHKVWALAGVVLWRPEHPGSGELHRAVAQALHNSVAERKRSPAAVSFMGFLLLDGPEFRPRRRPNCFGSRTAIGSLPFAPIAVRQT